MASWGEAQAIDGEPDQTTLGFVVFYGIRWVIRKVGRSRRMPGLARFADENDLQFRLSSPYAGYPGSLFSPVAAGYAAPPAGCQGQ